MVQSRVVLTALSSAFAFACKASTPATAEPSAATPAAAEPSAAAPSAPTFDPATVSDAPLTPEECTAFGNLRAADPLETGSALEYAADCLMYTADEEPWMRRMTRCFVQAPDDARRASCLESMPPAGHATEPQP